MLKKSIAAKMSVVILAMVALSTLAIGVVGALLDKLLHMLEVRVAQGMHAE